VRILLCMRPYRLLYMPAYCYVCVRIYAAFAHYYIFCKRVLILLYMRDLQIAIVWVGGEERCCRRQKGDFFFLSTLCVRWPSRGAHVAQTQVIASLGERSLCMCVLILRVGSCRLQVKGDSFSGELQSAAPAGAAIASLGERYCGAAD